MSLLTNAIGNAFVAHTSLVLLGYPNLPIRSIRGNQQRLSCRCFSRLRLTYGHFPGSTWISLACNQWFSRGTNWADATVYLRAQLNLISNLDCGRKMFWGFLGEMQNASTIFLKETNGTLLLGLLDMKCRKISMQNNVVKKMHTLALSQRGFRRQMLCGVMVWIRYLSKCLIWNHKVYCTNGTFIANTCRNMCQGASS